MRKILLALAIITSFAAAGQTPFPLYIPSNPDSLKIPVNLNGATRTVYNIDLVKFRAALSAHDTATALRLIIDNKADKTGTISINGNTQTLGSNPSFTVSGGGSSLTNVTVSVAAFGAKGDGKYFTGASISSGSAVATITSGGFTSADIGKYIDIGGAGAAGARLRSTIASVQSATSITLSNTASTTVSGKGGKYGTDNTNAFQDAIYSLKSDSTYNGKIIVPYTGYPYFFSKAPTYFSREGDSVNNAQLYIPNSGGYGNISKIGTIEIEGEISPNFYADYLARSAFVPQRMVILQSTIDTGSFFGNSYTNVGNTTGAGVLYANFTHLKIANIAARVNSMNGATHVASGVNALDFANMALLELENVAADIESPSTFAVQPDTTRFGIRTMGLGNWAHQSLRNILVRGFGNGLTLSEHAQISGTAFLASCYNGLVIQTSYHSSKIDRLLVQWSRNNIKITGKAHFTITAFDAENTTDVNAQSWQRNVLDIYEPTNTGSTGSIAYHIVGPTNFSNSELTDIKTSPTISTGILINKLGSLGVFQTTTSASADLVGNVNGNLETRIKNSSTGSSATALLQMENGSNMSQIFKVGTGKATYKNQGASDLGFYNGTAGNISMLQDRSSGYITLQGTSGTGLQVLGANSHVLIGTTTDNSTLTVNGSLSLPYRFVSGATTLTATDYLLECSLGSFAVTLPTAVGITGRIYTIKNTTAGSTITVTPNGTETIDGAATYTLAAQYKYVTIQSNGVRWIVIGNN